MVFGCHDLGGDGQPFFGGRWSADNAAGFHIIIALGSPRASIRVVEELSDMIGTLGHVHKQYFFF